jgi:hypothetical protein
MLLFALLGLTFVGLMVLLQQRRCMPAGLHMSRSIA